MILVLHVLLIVMGSLLHPVVLIGGKLYLVNCIHIPHFNNKIIHIIILRFGFSISQKTLNPNQRPPVRIDINLKVDPRDYTESDKELLSSIDKALTK